jgi:putative oxidoreductase
MLFPIFSILRGSVMAQLCAMKHLPQLATLFLRLALAAGFLSAVASRLGFWGKRSSGWANFVNYTGDVNSFLPRSWASALAVGSTILETSLGLLLLFGLLTRPAALAAGGLTLLFGLAMALSFGVKEPLDYSVFVCCSAALLLATAPGYDWSIDSLLLKK